MSESKPKQGYHPKADDPKDMAPKPPNPKQEQKFPGYSDEMHPKPDHGEDTYKGSGKLTGKKAIITGADSGIGRAIAIAFAREGADVLIAYLKEDKDAEETRQWVEKAGRKAVLVPGDISDEKHCQEIVQKAVDSFGRIDILVNNAAYQKTFKDVTEIPSDEWDHTFRTNIYAMFFLVKHAVPHMKAGSAIINTSSIEAYKPDPELLPYAATKGAIVNFTKGLSKQLIKRGIRVNSVAPGPIWTPLIPMSFTADHVANFGKNTPVGRAGQPAELAPIYVLLASDEASYVNGAIYPVTGGEFVP